MNWVLRDHDMKTKVPRTPSVTPTAIPTRVDPPACNAFEALLCAAAVALANATIISPKSPKRRRVIPLVAAVYSLPIALVATVNSLATALVATGNSLPTALVTVEKAPAAKDVAVEKAPPAIDVAESKISRSSKGCAEVNTALDAERRTRAADRNFIVR